MPKIYTCKLYQECQVFPKIIVLKRKLYFLRHMNSVQIYQELLRVVLKVIASCGVYFRNRFNVRIVQVYNFLLMYKINVSNLNLVSIFVTIYERHKGNNFLVEVRNYCQFEQLLNVIQNFAFPNKLFKFKICICLIYLLLLIRINKNIVKYRSSNKE